ncbi:MAG: NifB/NifX family molybdenum-iron cluster-binding protein [Deltaproteobacteria bacterium]|nr:NifB/NifX family molybdenum-iron cluster-binding protein [Deltaproteobacteria bacterium]
MKIMITAQGQDPDARVDERFGRAEWFILHDTETDSWQAIANKAGQAEHGAGVSAAQAVIDAGANVLLTGHVGPNAFTSLQAAGVQIASQINETVREAVQNYLAGQYPLVDGPDSLPSH